jgi:hypothetical protein
LIGYVDRLVYLGHPRQSTTLFIDVCRGIVNTKIRGSHGRDRMVVGFTTTYMQSVPITTNVSSNPVHRDVYSIQHYAPKTINDLVHLENVFDVMDLYLWLR